MTLYIDGDALPNTLKPILYRAILKRTLPTFVIANKRVRIGEDAAMITYHIVDQGADEADHEIVSRIVRGDLVITADIPLADRVIAKNAHALDHRGTLYTSENIKQYLAMRNLMENVREMGEPTRGPKPFGPKDAQAFASSFNASLDRLLT